MQAITILLTLFPQIIDVARQGQQAWQDFLESKKIQGDAEINAKLEYLKQDFVRIQFISEYEATH